MYSWNNKNVLLVLVAHEIYIIMCIYIHCDIMYQSE